MANHNAAEGPSLAQARSSRPTSHDHAHHHHHHRHRRHVDGSLKHRHFHHPHGRLFPKEDAAAPPPHIRSPPPTENKLQGRQVVVVQTVSVVHYIDATGAVTSVKTLITDPVARTSAALPADLPAGTSVVDAESPTVSFPDILPDSTDAVPSTSSFITESETTDSAPEPTTLESTPSEILTTPITTAIESTSDDYDFLDETTSSTYNHSFSSNYTIALFSNSTRTRTSTSTSTRLTSTTTKSSTFWTSTTVSPLETAIIDAPGAGSDAGVDIQSDVPPPAEPPAEQPSGLTPETRNAVVGGVVGSVAGIALIIFALLYLLKWRHRGRGIMLLTDADSTIRRRPSTSGGGGELGRRRSGSLSVHAALAKLNSWRMSITPGAAPEPAPTEKGFYRVSGRKLISVLESGGDGYSDPVDSDAKYRNSQMSIFSMNQAPLKLGSPMRPESGVPIFHDGPQRTAVQEQPPLSAHRRSAFPTTITARQSVHVRPLASRDGSRASVSRFTEGA
ncbi:hypothetical protein VTJ04DRAFT_6170 [Mycothermus thermophilus]|uniref:uncharacterized protein n=1 Tax=Humicola insolens TaxID=85995 RepID=UPI003743CABA